MKNLITYLKTLWRRGLDSQRKKIGVTLGEAAIEHPFSTYSAPFGTCWQPSGKLHSVVRCAAMLVMLFTIGSGNVWGALPANPTWTATALADIADDATVIIISSSGHALPSTTTSSNPAKISCTVTTSAGVSTISPASGTLQSLAWTVDKLASSWKFYQEGSATVHLYLSGTGSNTALRVGTGSSNDQFVMGNGGKLLKVTTAARYVGPYSGGSDWRTYNSETHANYGSASLTFYVLNTGGSTPSVTPDPTSLSWGTVLQGSSQGNKTISITGSNLTAGTLTISATGGYSVTPTSKSVSGTLSATTLTVTPPSTATAGTKNGKVTISGGGLASDVEVNLSMTVNAASTVTWMVNGSEYTTTLVANGSKPEFPSNPSSCDGTSTIFVGWTPTPWSGKLDDVSAKTIYTSGAAMPNVGGAVTYHAVFAAQSAFTRVNNTSELATGKLLVIVDAYNSKTLNTDLSASTAPTETSGEITPSADMIWTLEANSTNWKLKTGSNYLKGDANPTSGSKTKTISLGTSGNLTWVIASNSYTNNGTPVFSIRNSSSVNAGLEYSSGWKLYYTTNLNTSYYTEKLYISSYSKYLTTCCTDPGLNYGTGSVTKTFGNGTFKNTLTNSHSVSVTYESNNTDVATVASDGTVTIQGAGNATITARFAGNSTYCADEASYTLTVNKADISPTLTYTPNSVAVGENTSATTVGANPGSGGVTYAITSATPSGCATINTSTGVVSGVAVGSVTVTATVAATTNYNGGTATANVTIHAASYFTNGATVFVQAESSSAWDASACVKAWFNASGAGGAAQTTYWLFDATDGDAGKKLYATIVPATGNLNQVTLQRFASNCSDFWNNNGTLTKASDGGSNTFRSTGSGTSNVAWNGTGMTLDLKGDPNSWGSSLGTFADQGNGVWTATYNNYAPANAAGESQEFKISSNYNGWIGNTGSNNNATLDGMHVGSTYNITATLDIKDHSLVMSKTFVKGTVHFDMQGHGSAISDLTNITAGSKISAPSTPSATGYDFGGWYKEPACTNQWNFGSDVVNETMTLYAKWTKHTYTITSTLNHCSSSPAIPSSYEYTGSAAGLSYTISPSDGYRLPTTITVTGTTYTWNPATGALALTGTISSNVTITIVAVQTHTVDWYVGGSAPANKIGDDGQTTVVDHGGKISDFPATTPDGSACDKEFVGWTNTSSYVHGTSPLFNDVAGSPTINANASFYAVFATESGTPITWNQITDATNVTAGTYVIVASTTSYTRCLPNNGNSDVAPSFSTDVTISNGQITSTVTDAMKWNFSAGTWDDDDDAKYMHEIVITSVEETPRYLHNINNNNGVRINATSDTWTIGNHESGTADVLYMWCNGRYCGVYNNADWRSYTTYDAANYEADAGSSKIKLFKQTGGTTYTGHTINCADCGSSVTPTYTAAPTGGTVSVTKSASPVASGSTVKTCTAVDLTVTITPATHYTLTGFTATGLTTGTATISPAVNTVVPTTSEQTFTVTVSAGATGTLNLTPTFTAQTPLTITLSTNSKGSFTAPTEFPIYAGETFTFPDVTPNDPTCATFVGWIAGTTFVGDGTTHDAPATIAASTVSDPQNSNATYTAVFYETETSESDAYVKVTSTPANWANDHYLIVYEDGGVAFDGSRTDGDGDKIDAASNTVAVSITSSAIAATNALAASEWKIALISGSNYSIQSASGKYIGNASNSNALSTSSSALVNTLSISSGDFEVVSDGGAYLRYNATSGQERFRYYKSSSYSSQQAIQLYKLGTAVVETRTYTTNPSCTPKYRVTVASVTGGSPSADPKYNPESTEVTITANPSAGYSFTEWRITKTTGGDNVTSTLLTGDKPTTASTTFLMPAYDVTVAASYAKKMVTELKVMDGSTVVANTTGSVSGTLNVSTGANKTLDVVITPSDAFDHSWTATVSAGSTYASITNVTAEGFRVNGVAQGDATITVTASNDEANGGTPKVVTFTVHVTDILPEEIILKRDGSNTPIETLIMYYDASESKGQYVKVNVSYSPSNPTNKAFTFSSAATGKVGSHSHSNNNGYEVLVANGVTTDPVNCTFTSSANGSVTKVLAVTVLPILTDRFVDYVHGNATQTVSARLSADRYTMITDINTPSLSDASDANPTSEDCETAHYHLIGWLPQATAEALMAAGTPITDATEGLVRAGVQVEATGQTWCAIWAEEQ